MIKIVLVCFFVFAVILTAVVTLRTSAQTEIAAVSPNIVISQFQVAGDGGGTPASDEFVELHNIGASPIDLNGHRLVYRSANGTNDVGPVAAWTTSTIVPPGGYYLVASTFYNGTATPDLIFSNATCACAFSGSAGGLAIRSGASNTGVKIDSVGWGTATNEFVEGTTTAAPAANNSQSRGTNGCSDTDNNSADFSATIPSAPRNSQTPASTCSDAGINLFAAINANPNAVSPGGNILFTVTTVAATTPPSTGITVNGNLSSIGGSASQTFFDDGTNGDSAAGDSVFSFLAIVPPGSSGGTRNITATASDAQARTVNLSVNITVNAPLPNEDPLILGNPSNATPDITNENNYLMQKPQYSLSYNRQKATPNWVAWRLDSDWIGSTNRQDDFRPDPALPQGWYQVLDNDYSGSGYDRGHMTPSGDRTNSVANNSATFLMTNIVPQPAANNQGSWNDFEIYCRTIANQGNELYIITGPQGDNGTIAQGRVTVPRYTWKVVIVLPDGDNDLRRISKGTRAFGIIVPNFAPLDINAPWRNFRVTIDEVETFTGYNFFSNVGANTQHLIEKKRDRL